MVKLNPQNLNKFVELLKEEHMVNTNIIPIIYDILLEATGYVEEKSETTRFSKKEKDILRFKQRTTKENKLNQTYVWFLWNQTVVQGMSSYRCSLRVHNSLCSHNSEFACVETPFPMIVIFPISRCIPWVWVVFGWGIWYSIRAALP